MLAQHPFAITFPPPSLSLLPPHNYRQPHAGVHTLMRCGSRCAVHMGQSCRTCDGGRIGSAGREGLQGRGTLQRGNGRVCDRRCLRPTTAAAVAASRTTGGACLVDGVIMIEVQMCEHSWSLWAAQIDTECVWATSAVQRTHTLKRLLRKRRHISVFVVCVRMLDKRVPDAVPEKGAHVPRQTRSWCAHQSTPPLLGPSCHERLRAAR